MPAPEIEPRSERGRGRIVGRYALYDKIASGGMASVHFARLLGPLGFTRVVAVKRLHPQFAKDPEFVAMLLDEARLAARVRHPNVVPTIDVVAEGGELFLVMEYVQGESLGKLIIAASELDELIPPKIAITILIQALWGLHAAHEAKTPRGESLGIIHRDVSPQNVLVGDDGVVRIVDFGVAKAAWRAQSTREGQLKGKIAYMPPEQLRSEPNQDRRVDVYAASVCLWEALTGRRFIENETPTVMIRKLLALVPDPPSKHARGLPRAIDAIVLRGLARAPADRFATAHDLATELEKAAVMASAREVGDWVRRAVGDVLERRAKVVFDIEGVSSVTDVGHVAGNATPAEGTASSPSSTPVITIGSATTEVPLDRPEPAGQAELGSSTEAVANRTAVVRDESPGAAPAELDATEPQEGLSLQHPEPPSRSRGARAWLGGGAVVLGAFVIVSVLMTRAPASRPPAHGTADPSHVALVVPRTAALEPPAVPSAEPAASLPEPTPAAIELPIDRAQPGPMASAAPPPSRPRPNCHPPYTIDSEGVRIPKRECLHP
jgi:serine/threonine protein kinase